MILVVTPTYHYSQLKYWSTHRCTVINSDPSSMKPPEHLLFTPSSKNAATHVNMASIWTLSRIVECIMNGCAHMNVDRMFRLKIGPCHYVCPAGTWRLYCVLHSVLHSTAHRPRPQSQPSSRPVNMSHPEYWANSYKLEADAVSETISQSMWAIAVNCD